MSDSKTVFVNQLPYRMTSEQLKDHFAPAGGVVSADIKKFEDGYSRGWGLVHFDSPSAAENAVRTFNGTTLEGRTITVRVDQGPPARQQDGGRGGGRAGRGGARGGGRSLIRVRSTDPSRAVYVSNLAWGVTWRELHKHFQTAGSVVRADVMYGMDGRSKGCGIVEFAFAEDAQKAVRELTGSQLLGRPLLVREDREGAAGGQ